MRMLDIDGDEIAEHDAYRRRMHGIEKDEITEDDVLRRRLSSCAPLHGKRHHVDWLRAAGVAEQRTP